jgi:hypothetical protein
MEIKAPTLVRSGDGVAGADLRSAPVIVQQSIDSVGR